MRLHYTAVNYLNKLGIAPIVEDNSVSVVLGDKSHSFPTGKELIAHLKALDAEGKLAALVSAVPGNRAKSGMVYRRYKVAYAKTGGTCGDDLAVALKEATSVVDEETGETICDVKAVRQIAKDNDVPCNGKNPGHMLMNLSNRLRARARKGEIVYVDGSPFKGDVHAAPKVARRPKAEAEQATA